MGPAAPVISEQFGLLSMFVVAFGAATLLPLQSEIVFVALQLDGATTLVLLLIVASVGNTLGSVLNYGLGRWAHGKRQSRWFPIKPETLVKAQDWYKKWGVWSLLFSWAPLGDALTVVAGVMRTPIWLFVLLVGIAKTSRYVVLAWATVAVTT